MADDDGAWPYVWWWKAKLGDRRGQPCRVLVRGTMSSVLVEFADGYRVVTSRHAVRRRSAVDPEADQQLRLL